MTTPAATTAPLARLPAVRCARAEVLLDTIGDRTTYNALARVLVREYRGDHRTWTATQLERAVDDLAEAGFVIVTPGRSGDLNITIVKEVHA